MAPGEAADALGLRSEPLYRDRTFEAKTINGETYLVDLYNDAPKAVLEGGAWRRLDHTNEADAELMYGALVPEGAAYINPEMEFSKITGPYGRRIAIRLLGDWEAEQIDYNGKQIDLYHLLAGLRDGDGVLHVVRLAYDSPDIVDHYTTLVCNYLGSKESLVWPLEEAISSHIRVGEETQLYVLEQTKLTVEKYSENPKYTFINNAQFILMTELHNQRADLFQMTASERAALDELDWPDRVVTLPLPLPLEVQRSSIDDCVN